jgi:DNA modification methylase
MKINKIYNESCLDTMKKMKDESVDISISAVISIKGDVVIASIPIGVGFDLWFNGATKVVNTSYVGW